MMAVELQDGAAMPLFGHCLYLVLARLDLVMTHCGCLLDSNTVALRGVSSLGRDLIWAVNEASHDSSTEMTETLVGPEDLVDLVGRRCLHARSLTIRPVIPGLACRLVEERLSAVRALTSFCSL
jgi:hypothetical protein